MDDCHQNATCINIDGSFLCRCNGSVGTYCQGKQKTMAPNIIRRANSGSYNIYGKFIVCHLRFLLVNSSILVKMQNIKQISNN